MRQVFPHALANPSRRYLDALRSLRDKALDRLALCVGVLVHN
jgi:hypothetical protein